MNNSGAQQENKMPHKKKPIKIKKKLYCVKVEWNSIMIAKQKKKTHTHKGNVNKNLTTK